MTKYDLNAGSLVREVNTRSQTAAALNKQMFTLRLYFVQITFNLRKIYVLCALIPGCIFLSLSLTRGNIRQISF